MDKQPVGQLPDLTQSNNDDEIMVITNDEYNQLKKEKISDFITDLTSTDENNAIVKGTDGKLFTKNFGNASNITEGTLPVSVLPDIPKDKLPQIETDDLPDSGITAGTYTYPTDIVVNSKGQVTSITEGQAGANNANQDLSNLGPLGLDKLNQSKALETGSVSSDADVYADIQKYAHSTFDRSKFEVVGSPTITEDGIASEFSNLNYLKTAYELDTSKKWEMKIKFKTPSGTLSYSKGLFQINGDINNNNLQLTTAYKLLLTCSVNSSFVYLRGNTVLDTNAEYIANVGWDLQQYYLKLFKNNELIEIVQVQNNSPLDISTSPQFIKIGNIFGFSDERYSYAGTIDLKSIAIWADGVPVFNGNKTGTDTINDIEIPYTLSKSGSKIVDVAYRDRVQDMYEQFGTAMYYTLDEENQNFTLPMGDIYGMIERKNDEFKTQITNCILSAPNGVATFSGSNITLKQGLKMLYPNGRNADGTLKNGELTLDNDTIIDLSPHSGQTFDFELMFGCNINYSYISENYQESDVAPTNISGTNPIYLNTTENQMYFYNWSSSSWEKRTLIKLGKGKLENGVVTSFTPYQPVELIKRTDPQIQAPYITETYVNGTSWYRVWSDGWIEQGGISGATANIVKVTLLKSFTDTNYSVIGSISGSTAVLNIPHTKNSKLVNSFEFYVGTTGGDAYWKACGY